MNERSENNLTTRSKHRRDSRRRILASALVVSYGTWAAPGASGYAFNEIVPDVRLAVALSGGSACPVKAHQLSTPSSIAVRWSTALNTNPATILTQNAPGAAQLAEIEQVIAQSIAVWTGVSGITLGPASIAPLTHISAANACGADGVNSICFDQADMAFTPGVLAFTRVITSDHIGQQIGASRPASEVGQILDADIYFDPSDSQVTFATPAALPGSSRAYDLQSVLTHELGHLLGFSHSAIWSAMMYPYAPARGTFNGARPTTPQPDLPLGNDDRTGLRIPYPDPSDLVHIGSISGRVLPANPFSLPMAPPGVTGIFSAHVVAVDEATGAIIAGTMGGWSCVGVGPVQFDGNYEIDRLPVGHIYTVYAEPLDGAVVPAQINPAIATLCRNPTSDPGWPPLQGCVVPSPSTQFTVRTRPGP